MRRTAGRLKLHFSLALRGGLGCLEASQICEDLAAPEIVMILEAHSSPEDNCSCYGRETRWDMVGFLSYFIFLSFVLAVEG